MLYPGSHVIILYYIHCSVVQTVPCSVAQYNAMLSSVMGCCGVLCSAVQCSAVQCSAVQCSAVQCSAVQCSAVQWGSVQCSDVQCTIVT